MGKKTEKGRPSREEALAMLEEIRAELEALLEEEPPEDTDEHEDWEDALDDLRDEQDELEALV